MWENRIERSNGRRKEGSKEQKAEKIVSTLRRRRRRRIPSLPLPAASSGFPAPVGGGVGRVSAHPWAGKLLPPPSLPPLLLLVLLLLRLPTPIARLLLPRV